MDTFAQPLITTHSLKKESYRFVPKFNRSIEWFGGVNYENLRNVISKMKELMLENPREEIQLTVNSYGGATAIGMNFLDTVTSVLKPKLTTIGSGEVDSSGIIVFLAGHKRFLTKHTTMLLHLGGRTFEDNKRFSSAEIDNMLRETRLRDYQYATVLSDATNGRYTPEMILDLMAKDTILTAEEAVHMGLAHGVLK